MPSILLRARISHMLECIQVTLQFAPDFAKQFVETIYIDIAGRAGRVALSVSGTGLGPRAMFSYDVLDVGNVFIHTPHRYDVTLENRGEVPVPFSATKGTGPLAAALTIDPASGTVPVDASTSLGLRLLPDRLGKFDEKVFLHVTGTDKRLQVHLKGRVVGPTFEVDRATLDFGTVAYGFRCAACRSVCACARDHLGPSSKRRKMRACVVCAACACFQAKRMPSVN